MMMRNSHPFSELAARSQAHMLTILPDPLMEPKTLHRALHYVSNTQKAKRIRPILTYLIGTSLDANLESLDIPATAIELIHTYSLVHDDLPAMDDDDLRRGKPTCHIAFNEAIAILTGDALHSLAFELLATDTNPTLSDTQKLKRIQCLSKAINHNGLIGGQVLDLEATNKSIDKEQLALIHEKKTTALLIASAQLGAITANCQDEALFESITQFAKNLGQAFQIQDDILDATTDTEHLGKPKGSDQDKNKPTYATLYSIDTAKSLVKELHDAALAQIESLASSTQLMQFSNYLLTRTY